VAAASAAPLAAQSPAAKPAPKLPKGAVWSDEGPRTWKPRPTVAEITANDLRTRLYGFADDSMLGRRIGEPSNFKATAYIAKEFKRLGLLAAGDSGRIKLHVIHRVLAFRAQHPELFDRGNYTPLECSGDLGEHVCAFSRSWEDHSILVVVPRLAYTLMKGRTDWPLGTGLWKDTKLLIPSLEPGMAFHNVLTGETVKVGSQRNRSDLGVGTILKTFPVALLERLDAQVR